MSKAASKNKSKQTKFPVARIKKIMQKDEEVGKVAQATPIVISKALELFLGLLVQESSKVTSARGSKKVEAYHLKHAVDTTEILDFLKEIVQAVPDPSAGGTIDLEAEAAEKAQKKSRPRTKRAPASSAGAGADGEEEGAGAGGRKPAAKRRRKKAVPADVKEGVDTPMVDVQGMDQGGAGTDPEDTMDDGTGGGRRTADDEDDYDDD